MRVNTTGKTFRGGLVRAFAFSVATVSTILAAAVMAPAAMAADSAVIFMYHRFGEAVHPSTNIQLEQFDAHLAEIASGDYRVLPLPEIVDAFRRKEALPERTIGIAIDDAFMSVYQEAWPRLRRAGVPFTLFVATDPIDRRQGGYMNWEQLRELAAAGVTIGSQTASHPHLPDVGEEQLRREFEYSNKRFSEELGFVPKLHAYPFGEFGLREKKAAEEAGFTAAFGQHSGVAHANDDLFALPRFAMNENYGSIKRFRLAANALPVRVFDVTPADTVLRGNNPPAFGFTVENGLKGIDRLSCFASNQSTPAIIERLGERRLEVRLEKAFDPGRGRINCTMPAADNRWRWFGIQFYIPRRP
jgi:peptidoglycan/xylan/chitin deacetylase (PgdA/CDA1 family)